MAEPIVLVLDAAGNVLHSCAEARCAISWDGYVIAASLDIEVPDDADPSATVTRTLAKGERVPGASSPGDAWRVTGDGIARLIAS